MEPAGKTLGKLFVEYQGVNEWNGDITPTTGVKWRA
jgi:hypothetical protein